MRDFTYRSSEERENLEAILRKRKKKLNRQQLISVIIMGVIFLSLSVYVWQKLYYTDYDGYMHADVNRIRAPYDMYIDSIYVTPGQMTHKGDTLFSYYVMDWLIMDVDPNSEPELNQRRRSLTLQYTSLSQQVKVLDVRITELKKQIGTTQHNILFGLSDNSHKLNLERELLETEAKKKALNHELGVVGRMLAETRFGHTPSSTDKRKLQIYEAPETKAAEEMQRHYIVKDDALVIDVHAPIHTVFFEKENIVSLQHLDLQSNNLRVMAYIPVDKVDKIKRGMKAEVIVNDDLSFTSHVVIKGVRTETIPENLRSFFTKQNIALIAILAVDSGQVIPFWSATSGLPVQIRVKNYNPKEEKLLPKEEYHYEVGNGLVIMTTDEAAELNEQQRRLSAEKDSIAQSQPIEEPEMSSDYVQTEETRVEPDVQYQSTDSKTENSNDYYLVSGVFTNREQAGKRLYRLKAEGETDCGILKHKGQWYVYLSNHATKQEADNERQRVKEKAGKRRKTWVLYVKKSDDR